MSAEVCRTATPTAAELKLMEEWDDNDARAQTQLELTIGDSQMIHISGATISAQMWKQLVTVKELGVWAVAQPGKTRTYVFLIHFLFMQVGY